MTSYDEFGEPSHEKARQGRDDGIERAASHAGGAWKNAAYAFGCRFAEMHKSFVGEDITLAAIKSGFPEPPDRRAWGYVTTRMLREGITVGTGKFVRTKTGHAHSTEVWQSLIYGRDLGL